MNKRFCTLLAGTLAVGGVIHAHGSSPKDELSPPGTAAGCNQPMQKAVEWIELPGDLPFQALPSADGCWVYASLATGDGNAGDNDPKGGVAVFKRIGGNIVQTSVVSLGGNPNGMALTHDGRLLIVADGNRIAFLDTSRLNSGEKGAVLGYWRDTVEQPEHEQLAVTSDDKFLFVSDENADTISVIDLSLARSGHFSQSHPARKIPVGVGPVAVVLSSDERALFVTTLSMPPSRSWPNRCVREWDPKRSRHPEGAVFSIDVGRAEAGQGNAVMAVARAGCSPVRLALSPGGESAYVTARGENTLRTYDTAKLLNDPEHALSAKTETGSAPIGLAVIDGGRMLLVSNSHRFEGGGNQSLLVIDLKRRSTGTQSVVGSIPAEQLPREMHTTSDGRTLLVVNTVSHRLQVIDLPRLGELVQLPRPKLLQ